jgi:signal transduction histidine kinase/DNA-binding response OmpR family regulator
MIRPMITVEVRSMLLAFTTGVSISGALLSLAAWIRAQGQLNECRREQESLEKAPNLLAVEAQVMDLMGAGASLTEVLDVLTHAIESAAPECLCSVLLLDEQGQQLWAGSGGGLPAEYMRAVNGLVIGPDVGACGSAASRNETIVVEDIATDFRFAPVKDFVISFGLRACWSVPIRDASHNVLGTFAMYHRRPAKPRERELGLVESGAHLAANAIVRRRATERLQENADRIAMAEKAAALGIWELDVPLDRLTLSHELAIQLGLPDAAQQLSMSQLRALIPPDDWETISIALKEALFSGNQFHAEFRVVLTNGSTRWLRTQARVEFEANEPKRMTGVSVDITKEKDMMMGLERAKTEAEAANHAKSDFLANMSHEIRTPLNGVIGMTDLALESDTEADRRKCLETIKSCAYSLLTLINDILDFSKIEAGKMQLEAVDFNLRDCLEEALKPLALRADEKGIELLCDIASDVPEVIQGDSTRLRQVVLNLVNNAIKFTAVGEVGLQVGLEDHEGNSGKLHFTVSDTGIGIPSEKREAIFSPFTQADTSTTRNYGGTGLGLTICTRLVSMMGGTVWLDSEVGRGSQFHFTMSAEFRQRIAKERAAGPTEELRNIRVLIVDDNANNRKILRGLLQCWEMTVCDVESGERALEELASAKAAGGPYQILLTDMHMPGMDGYTLIEKLRHTPELSVTAIMMLTSAGYREDAVRCRKLGISSYVLKPIRKGELLTSILRALGRGDSIFQPVVAAPKKTLPMGGLRILLAEDNRVNQTIAVRTLEKMGHSVILAKNGNEVLSWLARQSFDLVLMDLQMPEMDGLTATVTIRQGEMHRGHRIPIIALTAHAMKGDQERCLLAGMDGYVSKPIRRSELEETIKIVFDKRDSWSDTASKPQGPVVTS